MSNYNEGVRDTVRELAAGGVDVVVPTELPGDGSARENTRTNSITSTALVAALLGLAFAGKVSAIF